MRGWLVVVGSRGPLRRRKNRLLVWGNGKGLTPPTSDLSLQMGSSVWRCDPPGLSIPDSFAAYLQVAKDQAEIGVSTKRRLSSCVWRHISDCRWGALAGGPVSGGKVPFAKVRCRTTSASQEVDSAFAVGRSVGLPDRVTALPSPCGRPHRRHRRSSTAPRHVAEPTPQMTAPQLVAVTHDFGRARPNSPNLRCMRSEPPSRAWFEAAPSSVELGPGLFETTPSSAETPMPSVEASAQVGGSGPNIDGTQGSICEHARARAAFPTSAPSCYHLHPLALRGRGGRPQRPPPHPLRCNSMDTAGRIGYGPCGPDDTGNGGRANGAHIAAAARRGGALGCGPVRPGGGGGEPWI